MYNPYQLYSPDLQEGAEDGKAPNVDGGQQPNLYDQIGNGYGYHVADDADVPASAYGYHQLAAYDAPVVGNDAAYGYNLAEDVENPPHNNYGYVVQENAYVAPSGRQAPPPPPKMAPNQSRVASSPHYWAEELATIQALPDAPEKRRRLVSWHESLVSTAVRHAANIIGALHDPAKLASMTAKLGGIAGGTKFIFDGLVFKLATDPLVNDQYLYGAGKTANPERAAKAASQELKGANALFESLYEQKSDLTVPNQVLVDYCGERIVVMPLLPIRGAETLIYGSCDAGRTVLADAAIHQRLRNVCIQLHLAEHIVGNGENNVQLWLAGDVEGHRGLDKKLYLLDLARTFPPEDPRASHLPPCPSAVFFRLIRPEFLRLLKNEGFPPLSSDSFTNWGRPDLSHNTNARNATRYLIEHQIPKLAWHLMSFLTSISLGSDFAGIQQLSTKPFHSFLEVLLQAPIKGQDLFRLLGNHLGLNVETPEWADGVTYYPGAYLETSVNVSKEFHSQGVPMRYLSLVHQTVDSPEVKQVLLREGVIRSFKNFIRADLRACQSSGTTPEKVLVEWFNRIALGPSILKGSISSTDDERKAAAELWDHRLRADVSDRFGHLLIQDCGSLATAMESQVFRIIHNLVQTVGIKLSTAARIKLRESCPKGHALAPRKVAVNISCDSCQRPTPTSSTHSCTICNVDYCFVCFGIPGDSVTFNLDDIEQLQPRVKSMSFIDSVRVQALADHAVNLISNTTLSESQRSEEFLRIIQQSKAICEALLQTDPTCVRIKEQLRYSAMGARILSATDIQERSLQTKQFFRMFHEESKTGQIPDGFKIVMAASVLKDRLLVSKAAKLNNLAPIRWMVETGGKIGSALDVAIASGNRAAAGYLLEKIRQSTRAPLPHELKHRLRKTVFTPHPTANRPRDPPKDFHYSCRDCEYWINFTESKMPVRNWPRFHVALDPLTHPHPLYRTEGRGISCGRCKKAITVFWGCELTACKEVWCWECIGPENDAYSTPFFSPLDTLAIDDAMLKTLGLGLQENHAFSAIELVGCPCSARATCEFFARSKFSPFLTSLDFSANAFNMQGMDALTRVLPTLNLRQFSLARIEQLQQYVKPLCRGLLDTRIEELNFTENPAFGDLFMKELRSTPSASPLSQNLRKLTLCATGLTGNGITDFVALNWNVKELDISHNPVGEEGLSFLVQNHGHVRVIRAIETKPTLSPDFLATLAKAVIKSKLCSFQSERTLVISLELLRTAPPAFFPPRRGGFISFTHSSSPSNGHHTSYSCKKGHHVQRGANARVYKTNVAFCDHCRKSANTRELWSCATCGFDLCVLCVSATLIGEWLGFGPVLDSSSFSQPIEYDCAAWLCCEQKYTYMVGDRTHHPIPLVSVLGLTALDLVRRTFGQTRALAIGMVGHNLQRLRYRLEHGNEIEYNFALDTLICPTLTDLNLRNPPVSSHLCAALSEMRLQRLTLKWERIRGRGLADVPLLRALGTLVPCLTYLNLSGVCFNDLSDEIPPYTTDDTHLFHCFTGVSELHFKRFEIDARYIAQLFQSIACNENLQTLDFRLREYAVADVRTAEAVASVFRGCPKLSHARFERLTFGESDAIVCSGIAQSQKIEFLGWRPTTPKGWIAYEDTLFRLPGSIRLSWMARSDPNLPSISLLRILPKISGLTIGECSVGANDYNKFLTDLLATAEQPRVPLSTLSLGRLGGHWNGPLVAQILANPVLQVRELCLHNMEIHQCAEALKGSNLTRLDLTSVHGENDKIVDLVVSLRFLTALNLSTTSHRMTGKELLDIIKGTPSLVQIIANCEFDDSFPLIMEAALNPQSNLMYLNITNETKDTNTMSEFVVQELLWNSAKPFVFLPIPKAPNAATLHWARMDRLGAPRAPKWPRCHTKHF